MCPVLSVDPGAQVTIDTVSHEGHPRRPGRDPVASSAATVSGRRRARGRDRHRRQRRPPSGGRPARRPPAPSRCGARLGDWLAPSAVPGRTGPPRGTTASSQSARRGALPPPVLPPAGAGHRAVFCTGRRQARLPAAALRSRRSAGGTLPAAPFLVDHGHHSARLGSAVARPRQGNSAATSISRCCSRAACFTSRRGPPTPGFLLGTRTTRRARRDRAHRAEGR